jgi:hypothetical protein
MAPVRVASRALFVATSSSTFENTTAISASVTGGSCAAASRPLPSAAMGVDLIACGDCPALKGDLPHTSPEA